MKYFIVMNEWSYPNSDGRKYVGDYDARQDALNAAYKEYCNEEFNFLEETEGNINRDACGQTCDTDHRPNGFEYNSSNCGENFFFRSVIIEREF